MVGGVLICGVSHVNLAGYRFCSYLSVPVCYVVFLYVVLVMLTWQAADSVHTCQSLYVMLCSYMWCYSC